MKAASIEFNTEYSEEAPSLDEINGLSGFALLEFGFPWCRHGQAAQSALREGIDERYDLLHIRYLMVKAND